MYNQVSGLPAAGVGTALSAGGAYMYGGWFWVFAVVAAVTLIGAFGAFKRTLPATNLFYREPKQLAPKQRPQPRRSRK